MLEKLWQLGTTASERSERAIEYARSEGIDLASAYTVLLGIISLEEAHSIQAEDARVQPGEPRDGPVAPTGSGKVIQFDPGFREAVEAGRLTARQAVERGDRIRWASRLAHRHGLPMELAFHVTDGKVSLAEALPASARSNPAGPPVPSAPPARRRRLLPAVLAIVALAGWASWRARSDDPGKAVRIPPAETAARSTGAVLEREVHADAAGLVTAVSAPTPETVLDVFCQSTRAVDKREPVRVVPTGKGWRGVFSEAGAYYAIHIRTDPSTGRVTAGDGRRPIVPELLSVPRDRS